MSKICEKCPSYTKPLTEGLRYFTMEACVEVRFPQFINLTIEACNVGSALAKPDTVLAICAKTHKIAMADIKAGKHVDTKAIVKKLGAQSLRWLQISWRSLITRWIGQAAVRPFT